MRYRIALHQSDEGYSVSVPGLSGCWSSVRKVRTSLRGRQELISSAIRSAVPDADQEVETDLSPQVADGPCLARSAKRHSDRRR